MRWTRERIVDAITAWTEEHGIPPLAKDWSAATVEHPERSTVTRMFGTWAGALDAASVRHLRPTGAARGFGRFSADGILDLIDEWAELYGAAPRVLDWTPALAEAEGYPEVAARFRDAHGHWPQARRVAQVFGSWNAALEAARQRTTQAGLKRTAPRPRAEAARHSHAWTRDECIAAIRAFHTKHGRGPGANEWNGADPSGKRPSRRTLLRLFGSMRSAVEAAGIDGSYLLPGRPSGQVQENPELERRIVLNRRRLEGAERALAERRDLILEALAHGWPQRRIAAMFGVSPGTVSRLASEGRSSAAPSGGSGSSA